MRRIIKIVEDNIQ